MIPGRDALDHDERRALTDEALRSGTPIIIGALMQHDPAGRRLAEIDLLVATGAVSPEGKAVYRPIDVKAHRCTDDIGPDDTPTGLVEDLELRGVEVAGRSPRYREDDCLQLAHYYRVLQAHGHAEPFAEDRPVRAGILGSERVVAWFDLNTPQFVTITPQELDTDAGPAIAFHRRHRSTKRTALDRYDFEFAFRLKVVDAAVARSDRSAPPIVLPVSVRECDRCPWHDPCHTDMVADDDVSLVRPVGYPEWRVHRFMGITTCRQLAGLDPETAALDYAGTPLSAGALTTHIQCARSAVAGKLIVAPGWDPGVVPRGDIEIDLDLENAEFVYLWGARLSWVPADWPEVEGTYLAFASFDDLDRAGEARLVADLWQWLDDIRARAAAAGRSVRIYGYAMAGTEGAALRRIAATGGVPPTVADVDALVQSDQWVDLLAFMRRKFWSNWGHGLKVVAAASGFTWRDEDPGGWASVGWYRDARAGIDRQANIERLLAYNEDDCAATAALR